MLGKKIEKSMAPDKRKINAGKELENTPKIE